MEFNLTGFFSSNTKIFLTCLFILLFSALMTWVVRLYALHKAILDIPNERSSHNIPTPRGGGIAVSAVFLLSVLWLGITKYLETNFTLALLGGGSAVAIIGYWDDIKSLSIRWRLFVHFSASAWAVYCLGGFSAIDFGAWKLSLSWIGSIIAVIGVVWCINLYNFMDGIDGLSGSEGIFIGIVCGIALWTLGVNNIAFLSWLLSACIAGFTLLNWPPAKIFLGDVGSGFLGYIFGVIGLYTINLGVLPFSFWWIISGVFLGDATITLLYRVYKGKQWYSPHREHAFQHLISYGANHKQVTLSIIIFNVTILAPIAFATLYWPTQATSIMLATTVALITTWVWIKSLRLENFDESIDIAPTSESSAG